jgi:hypothetical protein
MIGPDRPRSGTRRAHEPQEGRARPSTRFTVSLPDPLMRVLNRGSSAWRSTRTWMPTPVSRPSRSGARPARSATWPNRLLSIKGVRYGQLVPATGKRLI